MRSVLKKLRGYVTPEQDILRKRTAIGSTNRVEIPSATRYTPKRVLVADDNRTNRNVLAAILEAAGHIVVMVADGDEALEEMKKGGIDILLIDVNMPRLNGIDTCSIWREREGGRNHLPIIGVTADASSETETKCRNAGMDMRITKPVDAQMLLNTIEKYCCAETNGPLIQQALPIDPLHKVVPIIGDAPGAGAPIDNNVLNIRNGTLLSNTVKARLQRSFTVPGCSNNRNFHQAITIKSFHSSKPDSTRF